MAGLEVWLQVATRHLAKDSAAQVRSEIREHYELARDAAFAEGATAENADQLALASLGDPHIVNCHYREAMITSAEARLLRESNLEARFFCSRSWLRWTGIALSLGAFWTALVLFFLGRIEASEIAAALFVMTGLLFVAPQLPIYTPSRSRVFRWVKWALVLCALATVFGRDAFHLSWLLFSCLWPMVWVERRRMLIRRKLPVTAWPRQLFL